MDKVHKPITTRGPKLIIHLSCDVNQQKYSLSLQLYSTVN